LNNPELESLLAEARSLKIDTGTVYAWADRNDRDPVATLKAEIEYQKQLARDMAILGSTPLGSGRNAR